MLVDYHVHTALSGDAKSGILDCIKTAVNKGLKEIGISDHYTPSILKNKLDNPPAYKRLSDYVREIKRIKGNFEDHFKLKLGVEVDFIPGLEGEIKNELKDMPFDYVIGSVHFIDHWGFDNPKYVSEYHKWDTMKLYEAYFMLVQDCARSQIFDIIGHLDLIKKFGYKPDANVDNLYITTAKILKKNDVCIEVNTSGLRHPCGEIYPNKQFLRICHDEGIQIALGSDAHVPEDVGRDFDKAIKLIKDVGYENIVIFTRRKKQLIEV